MNILPVAESVRLSNVLVIGGGGFIGHSVVSMLAEMGGQVTVLGRKSQSSYPLEKNVRYVSGDFGERDLICRLLDEHAEIVHLAYATVPNTSFSDPLADLLENLPPTVQLFSEIAQRNGRLVLVSSGGTVYGDVTEIPIRESHPDRPISPYGVTKLTLENYAFLYARTHGLRYVCVRPANAFGVGQRPFVGQGFISTAIASVMRNEPIKIFGTQGTVRDYLYVSDIASGILAALLNGQNSEIYNIGSGVGRSNLDVVQALVPLMSEIGYALRSEHLEERVFDVKENVLDSEKLTAHTAWRPKVDFEVGLRQTRDWLRTLC